MRNMTSSGIKKALDMIAGTTKDIKKPRAYYFDTTKYAADLKIQIVRSKKMTTIASIFHLFDFCECGDTIEFTQQLHNYLKTVKSGKMPAKKYVAYEYLCDKAGLTDHGGSVLGAWLTDLGEEYLKRLNTKDYIAEELENEG